MPDESERVTVSLHEEVLQVHRRRVETGRVRVRVETQERAEPVEAELVQETVEVTRVAIDRPVDAVPPIREQDGVTIIPVVEEVLVVERRLILREEVHVKRLRSTRLHHETVMLRAQTATVDRMAAQTEPPASGRVAKPPTEGEAP